MKKIRLEISILILIIILAGFFRFYKLTEVPPSLNWDEVAASYNGWAIANYGKDEWGKSFPLFFTSFRDDKHPVHIYFAAASMKVLGSSDFNARFPAALIGTLNVLLLFALCRILFKNKFIALTAAFSLAVSPYNLHFSRTLWEVNFLLFFFLLGLFLFYVSLTGKKWWLPIAFLSFGLSLLSYHSSKVVVPPVLLLLIGLYFKQLIKMKYFFYGSLAVILGFVMIFILNPELTGRARIQQTQFSKEKIEQTYLYKKTGNELLSTGEIVVTQYFSHYSLNYLFIKGDPSPRNSSKFMGEFYWIESILFIAGLIYLIRLKSKTSIILLAWLLLAPFPSALVTGAPNAARAFMMMGIMNILTGLGLWQIFSLVKLKWVKVSVVLVFLGLVFWQFGLYLNHYYNVYPKKDAIEWQYGMKQIVDFVGEHPEYTKVYMTDVRSQPYIFFLNYREVSPNELLKTVKYNEGESRTHNLISSFGRFQFGGWDVIDSKPEDGVLYIVEESKCGGLRYKDQLVFERWIRFPSKERAFCMVSKTYPNQK